MLQNRALRQRVQELERQLSLTASQCQAFSATASFVSDDGELNLAELSEYLRAEEAAGARDRETQTSGVWGDQPVKVAEAAKVMGEELRGQVGGL